jgi:hypothetical protein
MSRVTTVRAPWQFALALMMSALSAAVHSTACAQNQFLPPPPAAPGGQPAWLGQTPMFQVGPDGAVNVDQSMMMSPGAQPMMMAPGAQPMYWADPSTCGGQPCPGGCAPPAYAPTQWIVPQQFAPAAPIAVQPPPPAPLRWTIYGEALWIHPTGVDMAHAQQQDGLGGAGTVPFGLIAVADPSYDIGFRIGGELEFTPCSAIFVQYAFYENSADSSVLAPILPFGAVGSLVHHPGTGLDASAGPVNATYDIEFQLADAAYRQILMRNQQQEVSVFAGARFAELEQRFMQVGVFGVAPGGEILTSTDIEFKGGGPMVGIEGDQRIGVTGFSAYGRGLIAALTGNFESDYSMVDRTAVAILAQAAWEDDRIVPMLDYELGLAWTNPEGNLRLSAGYMMSHWFNVVTTPVFVDAVQADNYVDVDDTISFDGLVGRAELHW